MKPIFDAPGTNIRKTHVSAVDNTCFWDFTPTLKPLYVDETAACRRLARRHTFTAGTLAHPARTAVQAREVCYCAGRRCAVDGWSLPSHREDDALFARPQAYGCLSA